MTFLVEGDVYSPLFQEALTVVPDVALDLVDGRRLADDEIRFLFFVDETDREAFEAAIERDSTVESFCYLGDRGSRWLYRVVLSEVGRRVSTYPAAMELDVVLRSVSVTTNGMHVEARLPTRETLIAFRDFCDDHDVDFRIDRIRDESVETPAEGECGQFGVTDPQREALVVALEMGYFDVPRRVQLNEVAGRLDVSPQALSARLRRGQERLVRDTLADDPT